MKSFDFENSLGIVDFYVIPLKLEGIDHCMRLLSYGSCGKYLAKHTLQVKVEMILEHQLVCMWHGYLYCFLHLYLHQKMCLILQNERSTNFGY